MSFIYEVVLPFDENEKEAFQTAQRLRNMGYAVNVRKVNPDAHPE